VSPRLDAPPAREPGRIVSLVPSLTESLFALGLGDRVVGVTDWCVHPADAVAALPKVGGTKDADPEAIARLQPDLVIANHEENTRRVVDALDARGLDVWVTYPRTVREGALLLLEVAKLGADETARREVALPVLAAVEAAEHDRRRSGVPRPRVFCPIWRDPWMAPSRDTYMHDMIELCGGENVTAALAPDGRRRRRPDERYPKLDLDELVALAPDVVWLPDEPYAFTASDARELGGLEVPAARDGRIHLIDGTWVSWYGPRIRLAIRTLGELLLPR
jgi:ABC-type Fe3+-hydroxamate transport system substrate-binding protein